MLKQFQEVYETKVKTMDDLNEEFGGDESSSEDDSERGRGILEPTG